MTPYSTVECMCVRSDIGRPHVNDNRSKHTVQRWKQFVAKSNTVTLTALEITFSLYYNLSSLNNKTNVLNEGNTVFLKSLIGHVFLSSLCGLQCCNARLFQCSWTNQQRSKSQVTGLSVNSCKITTQIHRIYIPQLTQKFLPISDVFLQPGKLIACR